MLLLYPVVVAFFAAAAFFTSHYTTHPESISVFGSFLVSSLPASAHIAHIAASLPLALPFDVLHPTALVHGARQGPVAQKLNRLHPQRTFEAHSAGDYTPSNMDSK